MKLTAEILPAANGEGQYVKVTQDALLNSSIYVGIAFTILKKIVDLCPDDKRPHIQSAINCLSLCFGDDYREVTKAELEAGIAP